MSVTASARIGSTDKDIIAASMPAAGRDCSADDLILYTGGTTGHPKGVMWPHASLVGLTARTLAVGVEIPSTPQEVATILSLLDSFERPAPACGCASDAWHERYRRNLHPVHRWGDCHPHRSSFDPHELWETVQRTEQFVDLDRRRCFRRPMVEALDEVVEAGTLTSAQPLGHLVGVMWSQAIKDRLFAASAGVTARHQRQPGGQRGCRLRRQGVDPATAIPRRPRSRSVPMQRFSPRTAGGSKQGRGRRACWRNRADPPGYYGDP